MEQEERKTFDFSKALKLAKIGHKVSRKQFGENIHIEAQYPTPLSKMTEPYLAMYKKSKTDQFKITHIFPVDLSCESIFAEDWYCLDLENSELITFNY